MIYGSVCSGIEAATQAWHPLGWKPAFFSEIEKFPSAVLAHHYPHVPNLGDMTRFQEWPDHAIDLLVGGTPCQSFSVAGLRKGLADPRGNLALTYLAIADRYRPRWCVWENVPGVLSSTTDDIPDPCPPQIDLEGSDGPEDGEEVVVEDEHHGNEEHALGCFIAGLQKLGYGFAYRVLDAQYVRTCRHRGAVPQRRRRVFVVGYLGDWRRAAAVLFDGESMCGNPPPRREAGQGDAPTLSARTRGGGGLGTDFDCDGGLIAAPVASTLNSHFGDKQGLENQHINQGCPLFVAHTLRGEGCDASEDGSGRGTPIVPIAYRTAGDGAVYEEGDVAAPLTTATDPNVQILAFSAKDYGGDAAVNVSPTLRAGGHDGSHANAGVMPAIAFDPRGREGGAMPEGPHDTACLRAASGGSSRSYILQPWAVRRLTPNECHRLQGFPDDFCNIPWRGKNGAPDGPQYKALGNSMAVNVMEWLGRRIQLVEEITAEIQEKELVA